MIVPKGNKFVVKSHKGKMLSKPMSKKAAVKRLRQVEYFKHHDVEDLRNGYRKHY